MILWTQSAQSETFVEPYLGATWYQYDHNSNHGDAVFGMEVGKRLINNIVLSLDYSYFHHSPYTIKSQSTSSGNIQSLDVDKDQNHSIVFWLIPSAELFQNLRLSGGIGYGRLYDEVEYTNSAKESYYRSGSELVIGLRGSLEYKISKTISVTANYKHLDFEKDLNREVSDYEVSQNNVFYTIGLRKTF